MLEEMERLKHDLQERTSQIEKEISKVSSSVNQSSENVLNVLFRWKNR